MHLNKSAGKHQSCCWLNDLCQKIPFHHQPFSLLKYENYKIKRIIKNCFLSFKNTKNLVIFRNWQEKNVKKPEAVIQRCSVKKGVFENFANQSCFSVKFVKFSRTSFFIERLCGCFWKAKSRSSRPEVFCKKAALTNSANQSCFPVNFVKFSKTAFFLRTPLVAASEKLKAEAVVRSYSVRKGVFENFANQRCFPVNFAKFSWTPFFIERLQWLLLKT